MRRSAARWLILGVRIGAEFAVAVPYAVARTGYAVNNFAATVTPFDIATGTTASQITVGAGLAGPGQWADSWAIAITPDGGRAYVTNRRIDSVSWFDTATLASGSVPVGATTSAVAIAPDGRTAFVTGGGGLTAIDTATDNEGARPRACSPVRRCCATARPPR